MRNVEGGAFDEERLRTRFVRRSDPMAALASPPCCFKRAPPDVNNIVKYYCPTVIILSFSRIKQRTYCRHGCCVLSLVIRFITLFLPSAPRFLHLDARRWCQRLSPTLQSPPNHESTFQTNNPRESSEVVTNNNIALRTPPRTHPPRSPTIPRRRNNPQHRSPPLSRLQPRGKALPP